MAVTLFFYGVRIKPFSCPKCLAFWSTLLYLLYDKYNGNDISYYLIVVFSLTSAVIAIRFETWMMKR